MTTESCNHKKVSEGDPTLVNQDFLRAFLVHFSRISQKGNGAPRLHFKSEPISEGNTNGSRNRVNAGDRRLGLRLERVKEISITSNRSTLASMASSR